MIAAALEAFGRLLDGTAPIALLAGVSLGLVAGLLPGISGRTSLLLALPLALLFDPLAGAVFLVALHSVVHTSGSVPAILFGVPTSAAEAATAIDGHALARRGRGAHAIGANLAASTAGGVIGGLALCALAPAAFAVIARIGTPEIAALAALGLLSIAAASGTSLAGGLLSASVGALVASVGIDPFSGTPRLTFGVLALWDGVRVAALVFGLFVAPELLARGVASTRAAAPEGGFGAVFAGCAEAVRHRWLVLRASIIGVAVGFVPGLGASAASWIAYGHASQTTRSAVPFGEGAVAGVIAPEAANNAKEGGALAPTLCFGVPASSGMGILLGAFTALGIEVGPRLAQVDPSFPFVMAYTNIAANLLALPFCLALAPALARFAALRQEDVLPVALAAAVAATLAAGGPTTLVQIAVFSALGLLLKAAGLPRAPALLGFVLGPTLESALVRASMIHGPDGLTRPGVLVVLALALAVLLASASRRRAPSPGREAPTRAAGPAALALAPVFGGSAYAVLGLPATASTLPLIASTIGGASAAVLALRAVRAKRAETPPASRPDARAVAVLAGALALVLPAGQPVALGLLAFALAARSRSIPRACLVAAAAAALAFVLEGLRT